LHKTNKIYTMKKLLLSAVLLLSATAAMAQIKYVDRVLNPSQITKTMHLMYGANYTVMKGGWQWDGKPTTPLRLDTLRMDVYEPTDGVTKRPLVIFMHSGSFLPRYANNSPVGYKDDSATVAFCKDLAMRGYVVASMTYRYGWNPTAATEDLRKSGIINAAYKGVQDVSACIRYFKENVAIYGNTFGVDTTKIAVGGNGTGGYISSAFASLDRQSEIKINKFKDPNTGKNFVNDTIWGDRKGFGGYPGFGKNNTPGYTSTAKAAFAIGGALGDSTWLEAGEIPIIWAHSVYDPFAPYTTGMVNVPGTSLQVVEVSGGRDVMARCQRLGNTAPYKGKVMDDYTREANKINQGIDGLFPMTGILNASGPYEWYDTNKIKMLPSPPFSPATILGGIKASNPMWSKAKAMKYVDSIDSYIAPRLAVSLGLVASVGIENKNLASNVTIAPNPTKNHLVIHNNWDNNKLNAASIYDMNGRLVQKLIVTGIHNEYNLSLPTGLYIVEMQFTNGTGNKKLVIE